tara:strand:+ start:2276 stop:3460 length:1185 start_codon:yes stop_codon:yes gene_type:complete
LNRKPRKKECSGALNSVRIIDLTRVWAGPLGTRTLADFGAEVIKISDPRVPLPTMGRVTNKLNRNKKNLGLRLDTRSGRNLFFKLVSISDVVIENFRPRVMRNLELTYDVLHKVNPSIIMCSMPGYGLQGPYSEYPAFGSTAEAISGINSMLGYNKDKPLQTGLSYADPISGLNSVNLIMSMLRKRLLTGKGSHAELALVDSPLGTLGEYFVSHSAGIQNGCIRSNKDQNITPHGVYRTKGEDNWISLSIQTNSEWNRLVNMIGDERLKSSDMKDATGRKNNEPLIDFCISEWAIRMERDRVMKLLQANNIAAASVQNNLEVFEDEHLNYRNFFTQLTEKYYGQQTYDGQSIPGNKKPKKEWFPMKELGEDTDQIVNHLLGLKPQKAEISKDAK